VSICTESGSTYNCEHEADSRRYWIAGQRIDPETESDFVWKISYLNGTIIEQSMLYTCWEEDQPSFEYGGATPQSCISLYSDWNYNWNDQFCSNAYCYVCEVDP